MFPTADMQDGFENQLERDRILKTLTDAYPELEDRIVADDAKPLLSIPRDQGGAIVVAKMTRNGLTRWVIAVPDGPEPTIHAPEGMDDYARIVGAALGLVQ